MGPERAWQPQSLSVPPHCPRNPVTLPDTGVPVGSPGSPPGGQTVKPLRPVGSVPARLEVTVCRDDRVGPHGPGTAHRGRLKATAFGTLYGLPSEPFAQGENHSWTLGGACPDSRPPVQPSDAPRGGQERQGTQG